MRVAQGPMLEARSSSWGRELCWSINSPLSGRWPRLNQLPIRETIFCDSFGIMPSAFTWQWRGLTALMCKSTIRAEWVNDFGEEKSGLRQDAKGAKSAKKKRK